MTTTTDEGAALLRAVLERPGDDLPEPIQYVIDRTHATREAALTALSDACVKYGRELAGLTNGGA